MDKMTSEARNFPGERENLCLVVLLSSFDEGQRQDNDLHSHLFGDIENVFVIKGL